jgi:hypothetical protein
MARSLAAGLMMLAIAAPPVFAQDREPLRLEGLYLFHTYAQRDGQPVCMETWEFEADGVMLIESGAERIRARYRTEMDRDGHWIVSEILETNGAVDCMGHRADGVTPGERRTYLIPMNDGTITTCPPPQHVEGATPFITGCYGAIILASEAG